MESGSREDVLEFYKHLPFNINKSSETAAEFIKLVNNVEYIYPKAEDLYSARDVLEIGCGTGWLSNSLSYWYNLEVTAIDFNPVAVTEAKKTAELLGINVKFECADLFQYQCETKDIVISNGVLHHTTNTGGGIKKCIELTRKNGKVFIGFYHRYGRKPFLDYFKVLREQNDDKDFLLSKYMELDTRHTDKIQAKSWFMDQVFHPYETQHTLKEVVDIFESENVKLLSTSINQYRGIDDIEELYQEEYGLYDKGMECLEKREYFPGFFYVLGERCE